VRQRRARLVRLRPRRSQQQPVRLQLEGAAEDHEAIGCGAAARRQVAVTPM
jgi:hypothetical protein